jgi:hypothetical protein
MLTPNLEIGQLFRRVRIEVIAASDDKQVPWESSCLTGNFYFNPGRGISVLNRPLPPVLESIKKYEKIIHDQPAKVFPSKSKARREKKRIIPLPTF